MVATDFCELLARLKIKKIIGNMLKVILCISSGGRVKPVAQDGRKLNFAYYIIRGMFFDK